MAHGSRRAVAAAIIGNFFVMLAKAGVFFITGSAAMMSEAMHSLADTLNQVLLMVGIRRSSRVADIRFPFGYGAERAVWALMSAVGIFFLGCGVTVYHGVQSLLHPHELEGLGWAVGVSHCVLCRRIRSPGSGSANGCQGCTWQAVFLLFEA